MGAGHFDDAIEQLENLLERSPNLSTEDRFRVELFSGRSKLPERQRLRPPETFFAVYP